MNHLTEKEIKDFVSYKKLNDAFLKLAAKVNEHIFDCSECWERVNELLTEKESEEDRITEPIFFGAVGYGDDSFKVNLVCLTDRAASVSETKDRGFIDLHTHSTLSDGIHTPEELVRMALEEKLSVLCITDHNAVNPELPALREKYPQIELPAGCEFSCGYTTAKGRLIPLHIAGIGFDPSNAAVRRVIARNRDSMRGYIEKTLLKLRENCGIALCDYDDLLKQYSNSKTVGRKHVAAELVRQGYSRDIDDAFDTYLSNRGYERPAYVSNAEYFAPMEEVIEAVTSAGGVISLCHLQDYVEKYDLDENEIEGLLSDFKRLAGEKGAMETLYSLYSEEQREYLKKLADRFGLMYSGASDYHGDGKVTSLGKFPYEIYERISEKIGRSEDDPGIMKDHEK